MKKISLLLSLMALSTGLLIGQDQPLLIPIYADGRVTPRSVSMESGFLPGKKFTYYPTIEKYDFQGLKMSAELNDKRDVLKLTSMPCSKVQINNETEFWGYPGAYKVAMYFQNLASQSGIIIEQSASDTLKMSLEVLDSRLIGAVSIRAHGLCKMNFKFKDISKSYCIDITDKDPHSPIGPSAFVTRKTGLRIIQSASIREVIELFLADLKKMN